MQWVACTLTAEGHLGAFMQLPNLVWAAFFQIRIKLLLLKLKTPN
jgi:hypothetical protein